MPKKASFITSSSKKTTKNKNTPDVFFFLCESLPLFPNNQYVMKCVFLALLKFSWFIEPVRASLMWVTLQSEDSGSKEKQQVVTVELCGDDRAISQIQSLNWTKGAKQFFGSNLSFYEGGSFQNLRSRGVGGVALISTDSARSSRGLVSSSRQLSRTSAAWSQDGLSPPAL